MSASAELPPQRWFADMALGGGLVFFQLRLSPDIAYEYISDAVCDLIGVSAAAAMADAAAVHDRVEPESTPALAEALALRPDEQTAVELKWTHTDGRPLFTRCWARARQRPDGSVVLEGTVSEITELRDVELELRHSEERHRLLAENAYDVVWTMALDGTITYVSPAVQRMRGFTPEEASRQSLEQIHPPESAASVAAYFERLFAAIAAGTEPPTFRGEHEYYRRDGSIMTGEVQVIPHVDAEGQVVEIIGVTRDVSERKRLEAELTRLAVTDPLTGLWNRRHGKELLDGDVETAQRRHDEGLCLLMLDVDRFKDINDSHGHQVGDRVLAGVAHRLRQSVRLTDVVARWGGDEFVILLRRCRMDTAMALADKVRAAVAGAPFEGIGSVSVSVGVAELRDGEVFDALMARADAALLQAKRSGRNTVHG